MWFLAVGIVSTLFDWAFFAMGYKWVSLPYWLALIISFSIGALVNFSLNKRMTFRNKSKKVLQPIVFVVIAGIMLGISLVLMAYFVKKMDAIIARMITTGIIFVCNFFLHKIITFGRLFKDGGQVRRL
jgi:putative flippase GtrA